jgi:hypothetical protein
MLPQNYMCTWIHCSSPESCTAVAKMALGVHEERKQMSRQARGRQVVTHMTKPTCAYHCCNFDCISTCKDVCSDSQAQAQAHITLFGRTLAIMELAAAASAGDATCPLSLAMCLSTTPPWPSRSLSRPLAALATLALLAPPLLLLDALTGARTWARAACAPTRPS